MANRELTYLLNLIAALRTIIDCLKWNEMNQESVTRRNEQNPYHGAFTNSFSVARICPTAQSAKPTGRLRMIFWPFKDVQFSFLVSYSSNARA